MKISKEFKIGIFALIMIAALYWGVNYLKGKNFFSRDNIYYALFEQTGDLSNSSPVLIKGVRVGIVSKIEYDPRVSDSIRIQLRVNQRYCVPRDSRAVIFTNGIMGGKAIRIDVGTEPQCMISGDTISTTPKNRGEVGASDIDFFKDRLAELTVNLSKTLDALTIILSDNTKDVHTTMRNLASLTSHLDALVDSQSGNIRATVNNVRGLSASMKGYTSNVERILGNVESITDSLSRTNLPQLVANLNSTVADLKAVSAKLNSGDGTLGLMINDRALYDSLLRVSRGASLLLDDFKANPRNYIRLSVFGGGKK